MTVASLSLASKRLAAGLRLHLVAWQLSGTLPNHQRACTHSVHSDGQIQRSHMSGCEYLVSRLCTPFVFRTDHNDVCRMPMDTTRQQVEVQPLLWHRCDVLVQGQGQARRRGAGHQEQRHCKAPQLATCQTALQYVGRGRYQGVNAIV